MIGFAVPIGAAHLKRESFHVNRMRCGDNFRKFNDGQFYSSHIPKRQHWFGCCHQLSRQYTSTM